MLLDMRFYFYILFRAIKNDFLTTKLFLNYILLLMIPLFVYACVFGIILIFEVLHTRIDLLVTDSSLLLEKLVFNRILLKAKYSNK